MPQISQQMRQEAMNSNQKNPIADILSMLLQTAQQQQGQMANVQGEISANQKRMGGGGGGQPQKPQANAYQKGVDKALNESGYAHASEAIMKGQDPMMIAQQSSQMGMQQTNANMMPLLQNLLAMAQQPQQPMQPQMTPIQQQAQKIAQPTTNPVMGVLDAVFGVGTNYKARQLNNLGKAQEIMGEQPLQKGRKEELEISAMNDFFKNISTASNKQPSEGESKLIGNLDAGINQLNLLQQELDNDPNVFKKFSMPGDPKRESLITMRDDVADILGRLRSGGVINPEEEKRFLRQLPAIGFKAIPENPKTARFKIQKLHKLLSEIKSTVSPRTSDFSNKVNKLLQMGASQEQIYRVYKQGGI